MKSPTGIIPPELMYPEKRRQVLNFLLSLPFTGEYKRALFMGWAVWVGVRVQRKEVLLLETSGVDTVPGDHGV